MFPDFWTKVLPTVCKEKEAKERDAGERETHIDILWRELLQQSPKPRPGGESVGVQASEPQAQNFRILRRQQTRSGTRFSFLPLFPSPSSCQLFSNLERLPSTTLPFDNQLLQDHQDICDLTEGGRGGLTPPNSFPSYT